MKIRDWLVLVVCAVGSCSSAVDRYLTEHPHLSPAIVSGMQQSRVINGMTLEEVKIVLGDPTAIEKVQERSGEKTAAEIWVYRFPKGGELLWKTEPDGFPQGMAFVVPHGYQSQQMELTMREGRVCKIHCILSW